MIEAIDHATDLSLSKGVRVLQTGFFGGSQAAHVAELLRIMNPPPGAHIVDAGCGIGEVALMMRATRPDLTFTLVNISEYQLSLAPTGDDFTQVLADFTQSGLPGECADIVMFNSALCQMPINHALSEARRLLKPGGQLFVCDLSIGEYREVPELYATFMPATTWTKVIRRHGFEGDVCVIDHYDMAHFAGEFDDFDSALPGATGFVSTFRKQSVDEQLYAATGRHERIGFQLSGGKDSIAALFLMRDYWDRMTVYWTNTGDAVPEVLEVIERLRTMVPNFVEIHGRVQEQIANYGLPSDLVPSTAGLSERPRLQDRFNCCYNSLMMPMHQRMHDDGVTLIVRGQKSADKLKSPLRSGAIENGVELFFPLEHWTDADVFAFLEDQAFVPAYYQQLGASPDCLTCSAYWSEGRAAWLKDKHPEAYQAYQGKLDVIRETVMPLITLFNLEVTQ